jgi:hypothetical protein
VLLVSREILRKEAAKITGESLRKDGVSQQKDPEKGAA